MKLYGYTGEIGRKFDRIDEASKNEVVSEMLLESLDIDMENITLGNFFLKIASYVLDLPEELWNKSLSEMTEEDIELLGGMIACPDMKVFNEVLR